MAFIKAVKLEEMNKLEYKVVNILAKKIGIFKKDDSFYAMEINCKHQGANLLQNGMPRNKKTIKCYRHGWEYDLTTGKCLSQDNEYADLKFFDLKIENDWILVSLSPKNTNFDF